MTPTDPSHPLYRHFANVGRIAGRYLREHLQTLATGLSSLWGSHEQLMDSNGLYQAVVASLAALIGRQYDLERAILAVVAALIRHLTRSSRRRQYDYPDDPDGWAA